ncbi:sensor histidine kinase [Latilactobacillus sakei]|uniref:sensor histidine kinase n=1 Tax=Latilactobacillus sakei TaxID=1599 RepID=UPI0022B25D12|nr:histidine kinase [Latilactobacillus sakei]
MARDLHDNLGQSFSMITLKAGYARKLLAKKPDAVPEQLLAIEQASRQNLKMVRDIMAGLRQTTIAEELINQERNLSVAGIILLTKDENQIEGLPQSNQQVLAQCLHEAVTNIIRYSHATECYVTFAQSATTFQMTIQDNGRGLKKADQFKSHGMAGMRERLEVIQGELTVDGRHGTTLTLTMPIVTEAKND